MASQDPFPQGGSITEMAAEGTKVPDDAGTQDSIPSVPRPDQITDPSNDSNNLGATDLAGAADNAQDVSRVHRTFLSPSLNISILEDHSPDRAKNARLIFPYSSQHATLPLTQKQLPAQVTPCLRRLAPNVFTTT